MKTFVKNIIRKIRRSFFKIPDFNLKPATPYENTLIDEIRNTFENLPLMTIEDSESSTAYWAKSMNRLKELVMKNEPRNFLKWDVILETMFVTNASYISKEFSEIKKHHLYNNRWKKAIIENTMGNPNRYLHLNGSSGNLIHHCYHIKNFEEKNETSVNNFDFVFEFGGGYGSMCRLFNNLNYNGKYLIFDLPAFSAIQKYYLKSLNLNVIDEEDFFNPLSKGVLCISDIEKLKVILNKINTLDDINSLFIATWSISETPLELRNDVIPLVEKFDSFLIAYQSKFQTIDNIKYFNDFVKRNSRKTWKNWEIKHLPNNYYLIGKK